LDSGITKVDCRREENADNFSSNPPISEIVDDQMQMEIIKKAKKIEKKQKWGPIIPLRRSS
jgi:hypothetical protein